MLITMCLEDRVNFILQYLYLRNFVLHKGPVS